MHTLPSVKRRLRALVGTKVVFTLPCLAAQRRQWRRAGGWIAAVHFSGCWRRLEHLAQVLLRAVGGMTSISGASPTRATGTKSACGSYGGLLSTCLVSTCVAAEKSSV
jgi:hypothetical protein